MDTFTLLVDRVDRHVKHYRDDLLKHDKASLESNPRTPFLHWTRETGTALVFLIPHDDPSWPPPGKEVPYLFGQAGRNHILQQVVEQAKYWQDAAKGWPSVKACHYFDGFMLREISTDYAVELARAYVRGVEREWGKR